ncbi:baseplate J/gp47 family protein [Lactobacillus sp. PV034]|uniref:baseplate J/gp47 family protein n=1 Tax=Lactobacillus sp. PV034 TaxID=2594495 RepID=UPI00223ECCE5|nr:baseplate J/gp47 family protein [Lactobacillus sp. PV034]QNQ80776.1 hypothetical protein FP432_04015 [Lactobacillus sp. PV034]
MTPSELIRDIQTKDSNYFLQKMLDTVPDDIDKREGSIIWDALAPAAQVMGQQALQLANIIKLTYTQTSQGEFLDYRAVEHGTNRYPATNAKVKAIAKNEDKKILDNVKVGDQFASIGDSPIFYTVIQIKDDLSLVLRAEDAGSVANGYLGQILPITPNDALSWAEITEIIAPARDEETDEHLRERLLSPSDWISYGGNISDYVKMTSSITDVGAVQVYPVWNGGGTVKLVILNNDLMPASQGLIDEVKNTIDPAEQSGMGVGLAPIDHKVTVVTPTLLKVNVMIDIMLAPNANINTIRSTVQSTIEDYFKELRNDWDNINPVIGRGYAVTIYRSKILSKIMNLDGIANAQLPKLNDKENDINLIFNETTSQLPILGEVTVNA